MCKFKVKQQPKLNLFYPILLKKSRSKIMEKIYMSRLRNFSILLNFLKKVGTFKSKNKKMSFFLYFTSCRKMFHLLWILNINIIHLNIKKNTNLTHVLIPTNIQFSSWNRLIFPTFTIDKIRMQSVFLTLYKTIIII